MLTTRQQPAHARHNTKPTTMKTFALSIISLFGFLSIQAQWIALESNTTYNLNDVHFVDHLHGFAVGQNGRMTATIDGGETWV